MNFEMYINISSVPIDEYYDPERSELVKCIVELIGHTTLEFDVIRLEGNQRFLVPADMRDAILDHLWVGGMLTIRIGRYKGQIDAHNFQKSYTAICFKL